MRDIPDTAAQAIVGSGRAPDQDQVVLDPTAATATTSSCRPYPKALDTGAVIVGRTG
jgi:hypothetical protein